MRIPVLIESIGPCVSSWVPSRGLRKIRVQGLDGEPLVIVSSCGRQFSLGKNGTHSLPFEAKRIQVKHVSETRLSVDLVS